MDVFSTKNIKFIQFSKSLELPVLPELVEGACRRGLSKGAEAFGCNNALQRFPEPVEGPVEWITEERNLVVIRV